MPDPSGHGRGIVTAAGGLRLCLNLYVGLKRLRRVCDLPVEVFHVREIPARVQRRMQREVPDLEFRELRSPRGYAVKPFALRASRFREVLWLDADNAVLRDPSPLFETDRALFWPDNARFTRDALYELFGLPPALNREGPEFESGQLVLDRQRDARALAAVCALHSERLRPTVYALTNGDKDTFRLAFRLAEVPYRLIPTPPVPFGVPALSWRLLGRDVHVPHPRGAFLPTGLLQHDPEGAPLFVHRTVLDWNLYRPCGVSTHVEGEPAPWLARLEEEDTEHVARFRRDYAGSFPPDLRDLVEGLTIRLVRFVLSNREGRG